MSLNTISNLQQQLQTMLGFRYNKYLENMCDWFGQKITKDFFDERMGQILVDGALEVHNEMMKQIIYQCSGTPAPAPPPAPSISLSTSGNTAGLLGDPAQTPKSDFNEGDFIYQINENDESEEPEYVTINFVEGDEQLRFENEDEEEEEDMAPETPVDWLFNVNLVTPNSEDNKNTPFVLSPEKFPSKFSSQYQQLNDPNVNPTEMVNITHGYDIADRLGRTPQLKTQFKSPSKENSIYLSAGATIHGRFLLKAWANGLDGVDQQASILGIAGVKEHIRRLIIEIIKQRRAFRMRNNKIFHSIGIPYANPYLRQGQLFDTPYSSDSTKMADVMQVPKMLLTSDEQERIASLQVASSAPGKNYRFPSSRATLLDLLHVLENDPGIVPPNGSRFKLKESIAEKYKGYAGNYGDDDVDDDDRDDSKDLLPICSY